MTNVGDKVTFVDEQRNKYESTVTSVVTENDPNTVINLSYKLSNGSKIDKQSVAHQISTSGSNVCWY